MKLNGNTRRAIVVLIAAFGFLHLAAAKPLAPPTITQVDYTGNLLLTDKNWFYMNTDGTGLPGGGGRFNDIEIQAGRSFQVSKIAVIKGATLTIAFTIFNPNHQTTLNCGLSFSNPSLYRWKSQQRVTLSGDYSEFFSLAPLESHTVTITVSGLPGYVTAGRLEADLLLISESGGLIDQSAIDVFVLHQAPTSWMSIPWTEVLYDSCWFADGTQTSPDVAKFCTIGLNEAGRFAYSFDEPNWIVMSDDSEQYKGHLNKFKLADFCTQPSPALGDCRDVSAFLSLLLESQGLAPEIRHLTHPNAPGTGIRTNHVCRIGDDSNLASSYTQSLLSFHALLRLQGLAYDATYAFEKDLNDTIYQKAPAGWQFLDYWQKPNGTNGAGEPLFLGLVWGVQVDPSNEFIPIRVPTPLDLALSHEGTTVLQGVM